VTLPETEAFWNAQLQNSAILPDADQWERRYAELSAAAARLGAPERIPTGGEAMQAVWRTPTGRPGRALVFVHGGYWRRFAAADFAFVAAAAQAADATLHNVDYRLMPAVRMADVVDDVVAGCATALRDAESAVIVGHSAGAHLAVEAALRLPCPPSAVVAISGLYDLDPLRYAFIQHELALTGEEVAAFSPQARAADMPCPAHIAVGEDETVEFRRQSVRFFEAVRAADGAASLTLVPRRHHMAVVADLADPDSGLSRFVTALFAP
jgi:arylformamidase